MAADYPIDESKLLPGQFEDWANEGYEIAKAYVYDGKLHLYSLLDYFLISII